MNSSSTKTNRWERSPVLRFIKTSREQGIRVALKTEFKQFFGRFLWLAKRASFVLVALATLIAILYAEENWRGKQTWEKHKRAMEAKGEKMDVKDFIPPVVPDEQNFAMTPLLKPVLDYDENKKYPDKWRDTNGYNHFFQIHPRRTDLTKDPSLGDWAKGLRVDLKAWQTYYRTNGSGSVQENGKTIALTNQFPNAPQVQTPSADILLALSRFDSELKELHEACQRPYTRFPVHYDNEDCWAILLPHLAGMKGIVSVAALRASARLEAGRSAEACDDVLLGFRFGEAARKEPFIVSQMVHFALLNLVIQPIWEGIADHRWSDEQLQKFQNAFEQIDALADYRRTMAAERAAQNSGMEFLLKHRRLDWLDGLGETPFSDPRLIRLFLRFAPRGWFYQNATFTSSFIQDKVLPLVDPVGQRIYPGLSRSNATELAMLPLSMKYLWAKQFSVNFPGVKYAKAQNSVNLALVACALERHRLAHGQLPEKLDELTPHFLKKLPHDLINGEPLKYRHESDGRFVLYSIGWDEKDEGGAWPVVVPSKEANSWRQLFGGFDETGDWVWSSPAK